MFLGYAASTWISQPITAVLYHAEAGSAAYQQSFYGAIVEDTASGKRICYQVSPEYKFWIIWNDRGFNGYFCPEPMTAMIDAPNLELPRETTGYREIRPHDTFEANQRFFTMD